MSGVTEGDDQPDDVLGLLDADSREVARDALERVWHVLGAPAAGSPGEGGRSSPDDRAALSRVLHDAWDQAAAEARERAARTDEHERLVALIDVLNVVRTAEEFVGVGTSGGASTVRRIRERLHSLDDAASVEDVLDRTPSAAAGLGFDRVMVSRVEGTTWVPERLYIKGDARWAEQILTELRREPLALDTSLLETQMVRRAVPLRVVDPANRPLMHRRMITLSFTRGYVAAPIVDDGVVVGFLHADCYYQGRVPSQTDVDALWLFTQSLGPMLARRILADRVAVLRRELEKPVALLGTDGLRPSPDPTLKSRKVDGHATEAPRPRHTLHEIVTSREADVLRLVSEGASNEQIARSLGISLGTVKSHVKRILRKLDVTNRAEAASLWLRSEYGQMPSRPGGRD